MLETLKKKWWLVAIVVVVGAVLLNNAGIINKSAEKTLKSKDAWEVTLKNPTDGSSFGSAVYLRFVDNEVIGGTSVENLREMDKKADEKGKTEYIDKNSVKVSFDKDAVNENLPEGHFTLKLDNLDGDVLKGSVGVKANGAEVSIPAELKAAK